MINREIARCLILAGTLILTGCANTFSEQLAAYSVATGFLTLCDDGDYAHALDHFGKPLKSSPQGANWANDMAKRRGPFGRPVERVLVSRTDLRNSTKTDRINFIFRASFIGHLPGEESVSVEKVKDRWQVYDYKFSSSEKVGATPHVSSTPTVPKKKR